MGVKGIMVAFQTVIVLSLPIEITLVSFLGAF